MTIDESVAFAKGFLAGRGLDARVAATWFPTGMLLHIIPGSGYAVGQCEQALQDLLGLLPGWAGEVTAVGWTRPVE